MTHPRRARSAASSPTRHGSNGRMSSSASSPTPTPAGGPFSTPSPRRLDLGRPARERAEMPTPSFKMQPPGSRLSAAVAPPQSPAAALWDSAPPSRIPRLVLGTEPGPEAAAPETTLGVSLSGRFATPGYSNMRSGYNSEMGASLLFAVTPPGAGVSTPGFGGPRSGGSGQALRESLEATRWLAAELNRTTSGMASPAGSGLTRQDSQQVCFLARLLKSPCFLSRPHPQTRVPPASRLCLAN